MSIWDYTKRKFGSLSQEKYDFDKEIQSRQARLESLAARVAVKTCNGWIIIRAELIRAADEASRRILQLSQDPEKNRNIIISEGAKRERDLAWVYEIDNADTNYHALLTEIEDLTILKSQAMQKKPGYGLMR